MNDQVQVEQVKEAAEQQEMQASRFQAFRDYVEAHWAMQDDPLVQHLKSEAVRLAGLLQQAKWYYDAAMAEAGRDIEAVVLELGQTVRVAGVTASYHKGIARPSWKAVAMTFEPGQELIDEHTKVGKPSVRIKMEGGKA